MIPLTGKSNSQLKLKSTYTRFSSHSCSDYQCIQCAHKFLCVLSDTKDDVTDGMCSNKQNHSERELLKHSML